VKDFGSLATNFITLKKSAGDFKSGLPDELKNDPSLAPIKDLPGLVKSYVNAQKLVGRDKIALPGENAKPEEWAEVWKRLGRPETPEGYKLAKPSDLPKDFPFQEQIIQGFSKTAHELGLTPAQVTGLYKWYLQGEVDAWTGMQRDQAQGVQAAETALRKEYGSAYEERVDAAKKILAQFGSQELLQQLETSGLGNNPLLVKFLANVAGQFSEDTLKGMGKSRFNIKTPEEARADIAALKADKAFTDAYFDPKHQGHEEAKKKYNALYAQAYPEEKK
jgi:hypothetical protein